MRRVLALCAVLALLGAPTAAATRAKAGSHPKASSHAKSTGHPRATSATSSRASQSATVRRTANGKLKRSQVARAQFMRQTGYPRGHPGYVIDHVVPLACGGADAPSNMQWQTVADAKAKDKVERRGCR